MQILDVFTLGQKYVDVQCNMTISGHQCGFNAIQFHSQPVKFHFLFQRPCTKISWEL